MITVRLSPTLGVLKTTKLESIRSFSNNSYYDANYKGINELLVVNDDTQHQGGMVPAHPHMNLEIVSYMVTGSVEHVDTLGNDVIDLPGNVYLMSAGSGLKHSETNTFAGVSRYIQIWFKPNVKGTPPAFSRQTVTPEQKTNTMFLLASSLGPLTMKVSAAKLFAGIFNQDFTQQLDPSTKYYLYVVTGSVTVNGKILHQQDAAMLTGESQLNLTSASCEVLFFEL